MNQNARVILVVCVVFFLISQGATGIDLTSLGYTVSSENREGERIVYDVQDQHGNRFTVTADGEVTQTEGELIRRTLAEFYDWSYLTVSYLRITLIDNTATVLVVPAEYQYDGTDLTEYLPSGMQFYVSRDIEYDFRIKVERVFVRLRGVLTDEEPFTERLVEATQDPAGFIERNDPDYVLRELRDVGNALTELGRFDSELQQRISVLREDSLRIDDAIRADLAQTVSELEDLESEYRDRVAAAEMAFDELSADYAETKREGTVIAAAYFETRSEFESLQRAFAILFDDFQTYKVDDAARFAESRAEQEALQDQITYLRYAFIAEANESFFGKLRPVEQDVTIRIVELYTADPTRTGKEIAATLSEEGLEASAKAVRFVLLAYLGVIEDE